MINFAKLSKVPPKRRMAAALRGFGFGNVRSTAQHLRGLGVSIAPLTPTAPAPAPAPAPSTIEAARAAGYQAFASGGARQATLQVAPVMKRFSVATSVPLPPPAKPPKRPAPNKLKEPKVEEPRVEEPNREVPRFGEGREEEYISPEEVEDTGEDWSYGDSGGGGGGGFAEGTPGDGSAEPGAKKKGAGSKALVQSGGLMAQLSALPMPVKVIGGLAVAYVVWRVLE